MQQGFLRLGSCTMSKILARDPLYYTPLAMLFVTFLLVANIVAAKPISVGPFLQPVSVIVYPLTYIFAVLITEVYGYAHAKKVIWMAMFCNIVVALFFQAAIFLPALPFWEDSQCYFSTILGSLTRVIMASLVSFAIGEFINAFIIAKMKVYFQGKKFWLRAISAMTLSEAVGTLVFVFLAFYGTMPLLSVLNLSMGYYGFKVAYAIMAVPILDRCTLFLKKKEEIDAYDYGVDFNPFK
jgi:queuosine precursor transporter